VITHRESIESKMKRRLRAEKVGVMKALEFDGMRRHGVGDIGKLSRKTCEEKLRLDLLSDKRMEDTH